MIYTACNLKKKRRLESCVLSRTVLYAVEEEIYHVVPVKGNRGDRSKLIFEDDDYYYIHPKDLLYIFNLYRKQYDMLEREYKPATLVTLLCDKGIAKETYEGKILKSTTKISGSGNIRYAKLSKQKIKSFADYRA